MTLAHLSFELLRWDNFGRYFWLKYKIWLNWNSQWQPWYYLLLNSLHLNIFSICLHNLYPYALLDCWRLKKQPGWYVTYNIYDIWHVWHMWHEWHLVLWHAWHLRFVPCGMCDMVYVWILKWCMCDIWHVALVTCGLCDLWPLKDEPKLSFRAQAWAKCLELLFPSLSTSLRLEADKIQAQARSLNKFWAISEPDFCLVAFTVILHFYLYIYGKKANFLWFLFHYS